jgi:hypothetical protein
MNNGGTLTSPTMLSLLLKTGRVSISPARPRTVAVATGLPSERRHSSCTCATLPPSPGRPPKMFCSHQVLTKLNSFGAFWLPSYQAHADAGHAANLTAGDLRRQKVRRLLSLTSGKVQRCLPWCRHCLVTWMQLFSQELHAAAVYLTCCALHERRLTKVRPQPSEDIARQTRELITSRNRSQITNSCSILWELLQLATSLYRSPEHAMAARALLQFS